jgi:vacuolar-type H+-ATPase subunit H
MDQEPRVDGSVSVNTVSWDINPDAEPSPDGSDVTQWMSDGLTWDVGRITRYDDTSADEEVGTQDDSPVTEAPASDGDLELQRSILEQARAQAHYEAEQIRQRALKELQDTRAARLEEIRGEAQREASRLRERAVGEAEQLKQSIVAQARAQAQFEAGQIREQALSDAEQIRQQATTETERFKTEQLGRVRADIEAEAARLREEAERKVHEEALRFRQDALAEAEQIKAAVAEHSRARSAAEASRILEEATAEAERLVAEATEKARADAERIREEATAEAEKIKADLATAVATIELQGQHHIPRTAVEEPSVDRTEATLLTASDIGNREFPIVTRGFDRESVRKWLRLVEVSHAILEEELDRARAEWERALEILAATRIYLGRLPRTEEYSPELPLDRELDRARGEWERSIQILTASRPKRSESSFRTLLIQKAHVEDIVAHQLFGYSKSQVRELLEASAAQIARLESQVANLRAENDELRSRMLHQVLEATPHFITVPERPDPPIDNRSLLASTGFTVASGGVQSGDLDSSANGQRQMHDSNPAEDWSPFPLSDSPEKPA